MKFLLVLLLLLLACQLDPQSQCTIENSERPYNELIWVCHNPESENHGLLCTEECFEEGDTSAFCWILETDQCQQQDLNTYGINAACESLDIR